MLTLTEAAAELGISAATLRHQVQLGRMQARLFGKTYVITTDELERYRGVEWAGLSAPEARGARVSRSTAHIGQCRERSARCDYRLAIVAGDRVQDSTNRDGSAGATG